MLHSSLINGKGLYPLLDLIADLIRTSRTRLPDLNCLSLDPELQSIYRKLDGDHLFIHNELHHARGFRKLHLEIARIGSSLQILHCVFFPDPRFDLPVFGVDLVVSGNSVSAAIVDLSPVRKDLPDKLELELKKVKITDFTNIRKIPEWGSIFSKYVCFIQPDNPYEEDYFLSIIEIYLRLLISYSLSIEADPKGSPLTIERHQGQLLYCLQQKRNDKTRNVLTRSFNPQWAERYIDVVLFECPALN